MSRLTGLVWPGRLAVAALLTLLSSLAGAASFDQQVEGLVRPLANGLANIVFYKVGLFGQPFPLIVLWLAIAAVFFTFYIDGLIRKFTR